MSYRVKAYCQNCKRYWNTKKKKNAKAPARCKFCGSTKVKTKSAWKVKGD